MIASTKIGELYMVREKYWIWCSPWFESWKASNLEMRQKVSPPLIPMKCWYISDKGSLLSVCTDGLSTPNLIENTKEDSNRKSKTEKSRPLPPPSSCNPSRARGARAASVPLNFRTGFDFVWRSFVGFWSQYFTPLVFICLHLKLNTELR